MEMTEEQIAEIEARAASVYPQDAGWSGYEAEDALPVVRDDVPALVAEVRRLRAEVERLRAIDREHCERLPRVRAAAHEACAKVVNVFIAAMELAAKHADTDEDAAEYRACAEQLEDARDAIRARGAGGGE